MEQNYSTSGVSGSAFAFASADAYTYLNSILYRHDTHNVDMKWVNDLSKYWYTTQRRAVIADLYPDGQSNVGKDFTAAAAAASRSIEQEQDQDRTKKYHHIRPLKESGPNQLFWCMYIAIYGYKQYLEAVHYGATNIEMREKSAISDFLTKNPKKTKTTNYKLSVSATQELAGKFMVKPRDTVDMCIAFSVYYDTTIYLVYSNRYLVFYPSVVGDGAGEDTATQKGKIHVVYAEKSTHSKHGEYEYSLLDDTQENIEKTVDQLRETHYEMGHFAKGLKGLSNYKVAELNSIAEKLGVAMDAGLSKQELYNELLVASSI